MIHNPTPLLTYNTGGSIESVTKETVFIVEQGDFNGVLIAIEEMYLKGKSYYNPLRRQRAEQYFNKDDRYQEYQEFFDQLTDK